MALMNKSFVEISRIPSKQLRQAIILFRSRMVQRIIFNHFAAFWFGRHNLLFLSENGTRASKIFV